MRIALFVTCLVDGLYPEVGKATVRLLRRLGHEVEVPLSQTCCGQMHVNTGYRAQVPDLVRNHVATFAGYDAVVAPSGSCVAAVRHQHADLAREYGDETLASSAEQVAARTYELSQFLVDVLGVTDVGAYYPHRVTYHPTCHSLRMLHVGDRPYRLLREQATLLAHRLLGAGLAPGDRVALIAESDGDFVRALIRDGVASAVHDVSDGGLLVAIAEMAIASHIGAVLDAGPDDVPAHAFWFGEDQARYVITVPAAKVEGVLERARAASVPVWRLGVTGGAALALDGERPLPIADLRHTFEGWLPAYMAGEITNA